MMSDSDGAEVIGSVRASRVKNKTRHRESSSEVIVEDPNVVDMGHGDIELRVNNTIFKTHKYFLSKFVRFEEMIQNMGRRDYLGSTPCLTIYRDERGVDDINNTFKILYASTLEGPFSFDTPVLISALRIATAYGFDSMRTFAIQNLENVTLDAIQRIQLAREFGLPSWEGPAYKELSERENPITEEEAQILGFTAFARVAHARENSILKKGKILGEREHKDKIKQEQEEKAKKEAEEKAKKEAAEKARREAEERAKREEEAKAKKEAEEKAKKEAEEKAKKEAEEKAKREAEEKARKEAEEKARKEAEVKAKKEAEEKAKKEAEEKAKKEAEEKAKRVAEEKAKKEAEERAKKEAEEKAKKEAEEKAKKEAEEKAKKEAEENAKKEAGANR